MLSRVAEELGRLYAEKAALRDQVRSLQAQVDGVVIPEAPSEQAVRILSSAQLTADNYVAEAEEFSRQVTAEARAEYEELTRRGPGDRRRDHPGRPGGGRASWPPVAVRADDERRTVEDLQEQVAYLKAFGQAVPHPAARLPRGAAQRRRDGVGPRRPGRAAVRGVAAAGPAAGQRAVDDVRGQQRRRAGGRSPSTRTWRASSPSASEQVGPVADVHRPGRHRGTTS